MLRLSKKSILFWVFSTILSTIIGIVLGVVLNDPIQQFYQGNILNQHTDIIVTVSSTFYIPNNDFLNLSDFYKNATDHINSFPNSVQSPQDAVNFLSHQVYPLVVDGKTILIPVMFSYPSKVPLWNTSENECLIMTPTSKTTFLKGKQYNVRAVYSSSQPLCENCVENAISIHNGGNFKATDLRVKVCPKPKFYLTSVRGDGIESYGCVLVEKDTVLPLDNLKSGFEITEFENYSSYIDVYNDAYNSLFDWEISAWNNEQKYVENDSIIHIVNIIIPNCTV